MSPPKIPSSAEDYHPCAIRCIITYTRERDLYDVEFGIVRQYAFVSLGQFTDIYADQLGELIERETGLLLTMFPKY
jgi:hypothetical protein